MLQIKQLRMAICFIVMCREILPKIWQIVLILPQVSFLDFCKSSIAVFNQYLLFFGQF
jgi:hypothetical protein